MNATNGTEKTGIGSYSYDSDRPHAVDWVDNTGGLVSEVPQYVTYTPFNKVATVNQGTYNLTITYGPDRQRCKTALSRNDTLLYTRYYADNYEEVHAGDTVYRYYYVYTSDGLSMVAERIGNTMNLKLYSVETDYLGSIVAMYNYKGQTEFRAEYDAWGRQNVVTNNLAHFQRGYCGHEHWHEFDLIDMNGRMYDPIIARFLSPDPFVQAPEDLQNYNRYSYCLNNPLKYTDPSGHKWKRTLFSILAILDPISTASTVLATASTILGTTTVNYSAMFANACVASTVGVSNSTVLSLFSEHKDFNKNPISLFKNSWRIDNGMFKIDQNRSFWGKSWQFFSRVTWELPQTGLGYSFAHAKNLLGMVDRVDYFGGVTFATDVNNYVKYEWGVSLSNYISIKRHDNSFDILEDPLLMHEYGHTFDSQRLGLTYLLIIGIPSAAGAQFSEYRANRFAERYFSKKFNVNWSKYIDDYPLEK